MMRTTVSHGHATAATLYQATNLDVEVVTIGEEAGAKEGGSWGLSEESTTVTMALIGLRTGHVATRSFPHSKLAAESAMAGEEESASLVGRRWLWLCPQIFLLGCALSVTYPTRGIRGDAEVV